MLLLVLRAFFIVALWEGLRILKRICQENLIIVTKILSRILFRAEREGKLHDIKVARLTPPISHLLFTNDAILFCKANLLEIT